MSKCSCAMCGRNNGGKPRKARGLYVRYGIRCDEHLWWQPKAKKAGHKALRTKIKQETQRIVREGK